MRQEPSVTPRGLHVDPRDAVPIWKQIEEGMRRLVASGALKPGAAVPSVRDLARDLQVNPATVVRAYQHLVDAGLLVVKRGEGTFVSDAIPTLPKAERGRALAEGALRFASTAVTVGASRDEAARALDAAFSRLAPGKEGEKK
jgi:GntR family transcriptional regulator